MFAVLHVGGSATQLGLILGAGTLVHVVLLLIGGVWADRLPRQLVMLTTDGVRGVVETVLAVLLISGHATLWELTAGFLIHSAAQGRWERRWRPREALSSSSSIRRRSCSADSQPMPTPSG